MTSERRDAYPLEALLQLREAELGSAETAHREALSHLETARVACRQRAESLACHDNQTRALRLPTVVTAGEALLHHVWQTRRRDEATHLRQEVEEARAEERASEQAALEAERALRQALSEKQVVEKHRAQWAAAAARDAERRDEEHADDRRR